MIDLGPILLVTAVTFVVVLLLVYFNEEIDDFFNGK
jgi:hypothetical protein